MGQFTDRVGRNIKKYRINKGITLKELAEKIGVTEATAQKYEAGNIKRVDIEMLKKIADALDVPPENLTEWGKEEYSPSEETRRGEEEAKVIKLYSRLDKGHKRAVLELMRSLGDYQERYNSDK